MNQNVQMDETIDGAGPSIEEEILQLFWDLKPDRLHVYRNIESARDSVCGEGTSAFALNLLDKRKKWHFAPVE